MSYAVNAQQSIFLAVSTKGFLLQLDYKLIEQKEEIKEKEIITKEVVMIPCQYCQWLNGSNIYLLL